MKTDFKELIIGLTNRNCLVSDDTQGEGGKSKVVLKWYNFVIMIKQALIDMYWITVAQSRYYMCNQKSWVTIIKANTRGDSRGKFL